MKRTVTAVFALAFIVGGIWFVQSNPEPAPVPEMEQFWQ